MDIHIGGKTQEYLKLLELSWPFTSQMLRQSFKMGIVSCKTHSNLQEGKADNTKARHLIEAFKNLKNLATDNYIIQPNKKPEITDMFDLTKPCAICKGSGKIVKRAFQETCWRCNSFTSSFNLFNMFFLRSQYGYIWDACGLCKGVGKSPKGKLCVACDGRGRIKKRCPDCHGEGIIFKQTRVEDCTECHETGKIDLNLWNPVIPKGAILG